MKDSKNFTEELRGLINCYNLENNSDTPDFILAEYMLDCLRVYEKTIKKRNEWWGGSLLITGEPTTTEEEV